MACEHTFLSSQRRAFRYPFLSTEFLAKHHNARAESSLRRACSFYQLLQQFVDGLHLERISTALGRHALFQNLGRDLGTLAKARNLNLLGEFRTDFVIGSLGSRSGDGNINLDGRIGQSTHRHFGHVQGSPRIPARGVVRHKAFTAGCQKNAHNQRNGELHD
eukprot:scaffold1341_cov178-Amphora_coffeaeformis.AAC.29